MTDKKEIEKLVEEELHEANKQHPLFSSPHEAYAVLLEEVEELNEDVANILIQMRDMWKLIRWDENTERVRNAVRVYALHVACEAIQVAAMCDKMELSKIE